MKNTTGKLVLSQETVRNLTHDELAKVAGGFVLSKATYCCPTFTCVAPGTNA